MDRNYTNGMRVWSVAILASVLICQSSFAESDVVRFNERLIGLLPPGLIQESLIASKRSGTLEMQAGYIDFGYKVCKSLSGGVDKKSIVERDLTPHMGEGLSNAIYLAAIDTLCPESKR